MRAAACPWESTSGAREAAMLALAIHIYAFINSTTNTCFLLYLLLKNTDFKSL